MGKKEKLSQPEYSEREILEEIFEKFQKLRGFLDPGTTAHLLINQELLEKLRLRLGAEKFGYMQKMPMKVSYPSTYQEKDVLEAGIPHDIEGELFTLLTADRAIPISCVAMPLDKSELDDNWDTPKFLAKMAEGPLKILFSKTDKNINSTIYLAKLRSGVFKISSHQETLERI